MAAGMHPSISEAELALAKELLRNRLDRQLVDSWIESRGESDWLTALLDHLRTRETPQLLFSPGNLQNIARRSRELDPVEYAWEQRIADEAVAGRMYAATNPYCDRFVDLDRNTFDFSTFEHWDNEAVHGLNRLRWYASLARHYWTDQNPVYFDALMREWDFYAEKVPPPDEALLASIRGIGPFPWGIRPPYYELDVFIRLTNWWSAYWLMVFAEPMTPERNAVLLARCLHLFDRVAARGVRVQEHNFTSMQMEAIYLWASALPEVPGMDVWRHAARNSLEASLARAVAEDGSHWEQSLGYHQGCIRWYGVSAILARRNGGSFAAEYTGRIRQMGEFLDALVTPDGNIPLLSDTDRVDSWKDSLALVKCLFPEHRFHHDVQPTYGSLWASDGLEWETDQIRTVPPAVIVFPDAGLGVARNHAAASDAMLILDNGPNSAGHAHMDNLNIHFEALGKPIIVDPGRWIYSPDPGRNWVCHTHSHNTIFIEDEPIAPGQLVDHSLIQTITSTADPRVGPVLHAIDGGIARLSTSFRGYTADHDARVWRTVLFPVEGETPWLAVIDRFESSVPHTWTNSWLLPSQDPVHVENGVHTAVLENDLRLRFASASTQPLTLRDDAMFWCPNYAEKSPARWLRFSSSGKTGQRAFVFVPGEDHDILPTVEIRDTEVRFSVGDIEFVHNGATGSRE